MTNIQPDIRSRIEIILSRKEAKSGLHVDDISTSIFNEKGLFTEELENQSFEDIKKKVMSILASDVKKKSGAKYVHVRHSKTGKDKKGWYRIKQAVPVMPSPGEPKALTAPKVKPIPPDPQPIAIVIPTSFTGKAGECAVMSELLFRKYNTNLMMVDDGIDIVASRNNVFYYIQVKTTTITEKDKIHTNIKKERFETLIFSQLRYIIVARCILSGIDTNLFFVFNNSDMLRLVAQGFINEGEENYNIKIRLDKVKGNRPYLYHDNKETDITFHMNRFEL